MRVIRALGHEGVVDCVADDHAAHRHRAIGHALGEGDDVGRDAIAFRRKGVAQPAEARDHFVEDREGCRGGRRARAGAADSPSARRRRRPSPPSARRSPRRWSPRHAAPPAFPAHRHNRRRFAARRCVKRHRRRRHRAAADDRPYPEQAGHRACGCSPMPPTEMPAEGRRRDSPSRGRSGGSAGPAPRLR